MHGWPMTWWEWHTVMPSLAKTHTVIAFDLPGLGNSTIPTNVGYTAVDTATLLHDAVTALGFGNVSILAHDLGVKDRLRVRPALSAVGRPADRARL